MTKLTPTQLLEEISKISDEIYAFNQEMSQIAEREGDQKLELLKECKSNAECELKWSATPDGRRARYLKYLLRGLNSRRTAMILTHRSNAGNSW